MNLDERLRLSAALFSWRQCSQAMRWAWYKRQRFTVAATDAFYEDLIVAHEGLAR